MRTRGWVLWLGLAALGCDGGGGADAGIDAAASDAGGDDAGGADAGGLDAAASDAAAGDAGDVCAGATLDEPCTAEGAYCGGPCTDPCSFCNIITCSGGTWTRLEVFPAPCFDCGDARRCVTGEQHCVRQYSDIGGEPDTFDCADNPMSCRGADATCPCLEATLTFDECVAPNAGEVEIRYFGG
ncbi:MAG: hypothetical protein KF729_37935 [Sandaracinaceae bacterium]|nr:hypothetical protein [Sandaracinaceae bacterium]